MAHLVALVLLAIGIALGSDRTPSSDAPVAEVAVAEPASAVLPPADLEPAGPAAEEADDDPTH